MWGQCPHTIFCVGAFAPIAPLFRHLWYYIFIHSLVASREKHENFWISFICKISTAKILVSCLTVKYTCREKFQVYGIWLCTDMWVPSPSPWTLTQRHILSSYYVYLLNWRKPVEHADANMKALIHHIMSLGSITT